MSKITTNGGSLILDGSSSVPKGQYSLVTKVINKDETIVELSYNNVLWRLNYLNTSVDDVIYSTPEELLEKLSSFSNGGGDGDGVTQEQLDGRVPVLELNNFLVGGESGNEGRKITPPDLDLTVNNSVLTRNSQGQFAPWSYNSAVSNSTFVVRSPTGTGKFSPAIAPEDAVVLSQFDSSLESKVDKVAGKGLSDANFTLDEKTKLSGLEDVHYKGWHPNLLALETKYPTADEGSHAFVDDPSGTVAYIWSVSENSWVIRAGESTELMPAQAKVLYESNPDTNAFTDVLKAKLEAFTANFTNTLKTAYDGAVTWITVNGTNVLNHLSNTNNPHNVTAAQLGIDVDGLENIGKVWTPDYSNMETVNRIASSGGSWTSDRKGFVYVLSRGYNASIYNTVVVTINGKEVGKVWVEATSGAGTARSGSFSNIYPVKPGDVVTVTGNLETKCLFIPGVWV